MTTTYTPQAITPAGVAPTWNAAASGGDKIAIGDNERTYLHIKNAGGSPITATIAPGAASIYQEGLGTFAVPAIVVTVGATTGEEIVGPFPSSYVQADGTINIAWSSNTSVTFAALRLPAVSKSFA